MPDQPTKPKVPAPTSRAERQKVVYGAIKRAEQRKQFEEARPPEDPAKAH